MRAQGLADKQTSLLPEPASAISISKQPGTVKAAEIKEFQAKNSSRKTAAAASSPPPVLELLNVSVFLGRRPVLRNLNWRVVAGEHCRHRSQRQRQNHIAAFDLGGNSGRAGRRDALVRPFRPLQYPGPAPLLRPGVRPGASGHAPGFIGRRTWWFPVFSAASGFMRNPLPPCTWRLRTPCNAWALRTCPAGSSAIYPLARPAACCWPAPWRTKPALLLLDEALSGLDAASREALRRDLSQAAREGTVQVIQVSHHPADFIAEIDNVLYLEPVS